MLLIRIASRASARALLVIACALASSCAPASEPIAGGDPADEEPELVGRTRLWLELAEDEGGDELRAELRYERGPDSVGPRIAEVRLEHTNLMVLSADPGPALTDAGKDLVMKPDGEGTTRLVMLSSSNTTALDTGHLATLRLRRSRDAHATLAILADRPIFAPAAAAQGLLVGDPIDL